MGWLLGLRRRNAFARTDRDRHALRLLWPAIGRHVVHSDLPSWLQRAHIGRERSKCLVSRAEYLLRFMIVSKGRGWMACSELGHD